MIEPFQNVLSQLSSSSGAAHVSCQLSPTHFGFFLNHPFKKKKQEKNNLCRLTDASSKESEHVGSRTSFANWEVTTWHVHCEAAWKSSSLFWQEKAKREALNLQNIIFLERRFISQTLPTDVQQRPRSREKRKKKKSMCLTAYKASWSSPSVQAVRRPRLQTVRRQHWERWRPRLGTAFALHCIWDFWGRSEDAFTAVQDLS